MPTGFDAPIEHSPVFIRVLNGFGVTRAGVDLKLPLGVQRLVACLAIPDRPICRDLLAGTLWLDKSEDRAHANLRQVLWRLTQIDDGIIKTAGDQVSIRLGVGIDLIEARTSARRLVNPQAELLNCDLDAGVRFGDLLPGWYDDWVIVERERFSQLRLYALEHLCLRLAQLGRYAQAVDAGLACIAAEPLRESAHRALIAAHFADGNWREGLRQFERYEADLSSTLGLRPSKAMADLVEPLRCGVPLARAPQERILGSARHGGTV